MKTPSVNLAQAVSLQALGPQQTERIYALVGIGGVAGDALRLDPLSTNYSRAPSRYLIHRTASLQGFHRTGKLF
jgi:hypothetical protein